jgi:hypothetical protein
MTGWLAVLATGAAPPPSVPPGRGPDPGFYLATPGLNIGQLLGILLPLIICAIAVLTYRDMKLVRGQKETAQLVRKAVEDLVAVLTERLETKENVALIRIEAARLRTELITLREVIREQDHKLDRVMADIQRKRDGLPWERRRTSALGTRVRPYMRRPRGND